MRTFSLDDLETLSPGIKRIICDILYLPLTGHLYSLMVRELEKRLAKNRITADEVSVTEGDAKGLMLQEALQYASHNHRLSHDNKKLTKCHK